jgi:hypothetical protein
MIGIAISPVLPDLLVLHASVFVFSEPVERLGQGKMREDDTVEPVAVDADGALPPAAKERYAVRSSTNPAPEDVST